MTGKRKNRNVNAIVKIDQKCFCYHAPKKGDISKTKKLRGWGYLVWKIPSKKWGSWGGAPMNAFIWRPSWLNHYFRLGDYYEMYEQRLTIETEWFQDLVRHNALSLQGIDTEFRILVLARVNVIEFQIFFSLILAGVESAFPSTRKFVQIWGRACQLTKVILIEPPWPRFFQDSCKIFKTPFKILPNVQGSFKIFCQILSKSTLRKH